MAVPNTQEFEDSLGPEATAKRKQEERDAGKGSPPFGKNDGLDLRDRPNVMPERPTTYGGIMDVAHRFGKLKLEEKELKAKMDALKLSIAPLHDQMLAHMEEACISSMKLGMGLSLYLHTQIWAKLPEGVEKSELIAQLKASADTDFLVAESYNSQKLSAFVREFPEDDSGEKIIPDELKGLLEANEVVQVRARKS